MYNDPTVERIRKVRKEISERFNNDPKKIGDHYMRLQKKIEEKRKKLVVKEEQIQYRTKRKS